jgi:AcrR family transcriptional regulator
VRALPGQASRVPPGPRPVTRTEAAADQRRRILRATAELVAKRGYHDTTTELIVRRAKVGYATFYKNFSDKEECFVTLFDRTLELTGNAVAAAYEEGGEEKPWAERVGAALRKLYELTAADPPLARACLVESLTAGRAVTARYEMALRELARILEPGRKLAPAGVELPAMLESTLAGGVLWIIYQRLIVGEADLLEGLLPETLQFVLSPYLGEDEAVRVAERISAERVTESA